MTYCCDDCSFVFFRMGEVPECSSCGGLRVRPATAEETARLQELLTIEYGRSGMR